MISSATVCLSSKEIFNVSYNVPCFFTNLSFRRCYFPIYNCNYLTTGWRVKNENVECRFQGSPGKAHNVPNSLNTSPKTNGMYVFMLCRSGTPSFQNLLRKRIPKSKMRQITIRNFCNHRASEAQKNKEPFNRTANSSLKILPV